MTLHRIFTFVCTLCLLAPLVRAEEVVEQGVKQLADAIAKHIDESGKQKVAVVDFANLDGSISPLGQYLAERLCAELCSLAQDKFEVVERRLLSTALAEKKLTSSQLFDNESLADVGSFLRVQHIVTGTITDFGDQVEVIGKLINVRTGGIAVANPVRMRKQGEIQVLMNQGLVRPAPQKKNSDTPSRAPGAEAQDKSQLASGTTEGGVVVEITGIRREGASVYVDFAATSPERDVLVTVRVGKNDSRVIDPQGNEKFAKRITFGQKSSAYEVAASLIKGVRTNGTLDFEGVPAEAAAFAVVEIVGSIKLDPDSRAAKKIALPFRDLAIK